MPGKARCDPKTRKKEKQINKQKQINNKDGNIC